MLQSVDNSETFKWFKVITEYHSFFKKHIGHGIILYENIKDVAGVFNTQKSIKCLAWIFASYVDKNSV